METNSTTGLSMDSPATMEDRSRDALGEWNQEREQALIERSMRGDEQAFDELVTEYWGDIRAYSKSILGKYHLAADAEDVAVDAFCRSWRSIGLFHNKCSFKQWVMTIARRLCIDRLRVAVRHPQTELVNEFIESIQDEASASDIYAVVMTREERDRLEAFLSQFPSDAKLVLLRFLDGWSDREIATSSNKTVDQINGLKLRTCRKLKNWVSTLIYSPTTLGKKGNL